MTTAASLSQLLSTEADINFYTRQQVYWANMYEGNAEKLSKQVGLEEKWVDAYDDAQDSDKKINFRDFHKDKDEVWNDAKAKAYADAKIKEYDEELKEELTQKDIEYETMKNMYETMLTNLRAREEGEKQLVQTNAQKTFLLGGG